MISIYMLGNGLTLLDTMAINYLIHVWNPGGAYTVIAAISLDLALLQLALFRRVRALE